MKHETTLDDVSADDLPAYCGLDEETLQARKPRIEELMSRGQRARPTDGGWRLSFPGDRDTLGLVFAFVQAERECCPMGTFTVEATGPEEPVHLTFTGPGPMQEDIREGLELDRWFDDVAPA
jgi:hypothetical protein